MLAYTLPAISPPHRAGFVRASTGTRSSAGTGGSGTYCPPPMRGTSSSHGRSSARYSLPCRNASASGGHMSPCTGGPVTQYTTSASRDHAAASPRGGKVAARAVTAPMVRAPTVIGRIVSAARWATATRCGRWEGGGAPGRNRTRDLMVRSHPLCPLSYGRARGHCMGLALLGPTRPGSNESPVGRVAWTDDVSYPSAESFEVAPGRRGRCDYSLGLRVPLTDPNQQWHAGRVFLPGANGLARSSRCVGSDRRHDPAALASHGHAPARRYRRHCWWGALDIHQLLLLHLGTRHRGALRPDIGILDQHRKHDCPTSGWHCHGLVGWPCACRRRS